MWQWFVESSWVEAIRREILFWIVAWGLAGFLLRCYQWEGFYIEYCLCWTVEFQFMRIVFLASSTLLFDYVVLNWDMSPGKEREGERGMWQEFFRWVFLRLMEVFVDSTRFKCCHNGLFNLKIFQKLVSPTAMLLDEVGKWDKSVKSVCWNFFLLLLILFFYFLLVF